MKYEPDQPNMMTNNLHKFWYIKGNYTGLPICIRAFAEKTCYHTRYFEHLIFLCLKHTTREAIFSKRRAFNPNFKAFLNVTTPPPPYHCTGVIERKLNLPKICKVKSGQKFKSSRYTYLSTDIQCS